MNTMSRGALDSHFDRNPLVVVGSPIFIGVKKKLDAIAAGMVTDIAEVGSRITRNPPSESSDFDFLVLVKSIDDFIEAVGEEGFDVEGGMAYSSSGEKPVFISFRYLDEQKNEINLIVTEEVDFYKKFLLATHVAKRLNLMERHERVTLFQAILYLRYVECGDGD